MWAANCSRPQLGADLVGQQTQCVAGGQLEVSPKGAVFVGHVWARAVWACSPTGPSSWQDWWPPTWCCVQAEEPQIGRRATSLASTKGAQATRSGAKLARAQFVIIIISIAQAELCRRGAAAAHTLWLAGDKWKTAAAREAPARCGNKGPASRASGWSEAGA